MKKERKFFWCAGSLCGSTLGGHPIGHDKHPISELAQELENRDLCKNCYDAGLRLRMEATVYWPRNGVVVNENRMQ